MDAHDFMALYTFKAQLLLTSFAPASAQDCWRREPGLSSQGPETGECTVASVKRSVKTARPAPHKPVARAERLSITNLIYLALLNPSDYLLSSWHSPPTTASELLCRGTEVVWGKVSPLLWVWPHSRSILHLRGGSDHRKYHVWLYCCISQYAQWEGRLLRHSQQIQVYTYEYICISDIYI